MPLEIDALIALDDLDAALAERPSLAAPFEARLDAQLDHAFGGGPGAPAAHLYVQRTLYRVNRLSFFWDDDLASYANERSAYLLRTRARIEERWQAWELRQMSADLDRLRRTPDVAAALRARAARDLAPQPGPRDRAFAAYLDEAGYRRLLEIFSLDALVEASQMSRTLGGVAGPVHAYMTRLLLEEYGGGRLHHKHSSYFAEMLDHFGMDTRPEAYFLAVPWEVLAAINHSFLLSERKRWYFRYLGGLLYTETSTPAAFARYLRAAERLGAPPKAASYWSVHIKADAVHGRWMLDEVALPMAERHPADAWELLWGYDQQAFLADRASASMLAAVAAARRPAHATPLAQRPSHAAA